MDIQIIQESIKLNKTHTLLNIAFISPLTMNWVYNIYVCKYTFKEKDMKKINKKILYGMGAISIVASPIIAVVACGSKTPAPKTPPEPKPTVPKISTIVNIDLATIESPMELILKMNDSMHFKAKTPAAISGEPVNDKSKNDNYPLTKAQYQQIADNVITDTTFNFTYKNKENKETTLAVTSQLNHDTTVIKNSIDDFLSE
jgi:hypothetical protein